MYRLSGKFCGYSELQYRYVYILRNIDNTVLFSQKLTA